MVVAHPRRGGGESRQVEVVVGDGEARVGVGEQVARHGRRRDAVPHERGDLLPVIREGQVTSRVGRVRVAARDVSVRVGRQPRRTRRRPHADLSRLTILRPAPDERAVATSAHRR